MEPTRYLKEVPHLGINKYHSPSYHRINDSDDIYDYLYENIGVSGKHSLQFHQAANSIDNAGKKCINAILIIEICCVLIKDII
jgi:hypothetical protein